VRRIAALLAHHPVVDRQGDVVTTAITNLDLHDIARSALSYGLSDFFVAHPITAQRELARRVRAHWTEGSGARRIPDRKAAMEILQVVESIDEAKSILCDPEVWVTSASRGGNCLAHDSARLRLQREGPAVLIVFGTGWGLAPEILDTASERLEPLVSPRPDGYNHLSVRAAAAIIFDRLLGPR
jgi:hypothetical protein